MTRNALITHLRQAGYTAAPAMVHGRELAQVQVGGVKVYLDTNPIRQAKVVDFEVHDGWTAKGNQHEQWRALMGALERLAAKNGVAVPSARGGTMPVER